MSNQEKARLTWADRLPLQHQETLSQMVSELVKNRSRDTKRKLEKLTYQHDDLQ